LLDYLPFNHISYPYFSGQEIIIELKLIHDLYQRVYLNDILHLQANQMTVTQAIYISDTTYIHIFTYAHIHTFKELQYYTTGPPLVRTHHWCEPARGVANILVVRDYETRFCDVIFKG
jgi:hypothetical protein